MNSEWTTVITNRSNGMLDGLKQLNNYGDLIRLFAKRNISVKYKQTILGPLWIIIVPIISALISTFVFGYVAKIDTGVSYFAFYFAGHTLWSFFSTCTTSTSTVFTSNAHLFRKIYFPRLVVPISTLLSNLLQFAIQFAVMTIVLISFAVADGNILPEWSYIWLLPLLIIETGAFALGVGSIFSALTAKYRDLSAICGFIINLWMYVTPVVYSSWSLKGLEWIIYANPMASVIEAFRFVLLGSAGGVLNWWGLLASFGEIVLITFVGLWLFHKTEKNFVDVV